MLNPILPISISLVKLTNRFKHGYILFQVVENKYETVLLFEDDIRFELSFRSRLKQLMDEMEKLDMDWDLL